MSSINEILKKGLSLEEIGVKNWALPKEDALSVLKKFHAMQIPVLGGDVCEIIDGVIQYNYDNWYCDRLSNESYSAFAHRSIEKAKDYIKSYKSNQSAKIFFAFVLDE
ncbi:MAG: Imm40 family immunity protein [Saprospiraceae bacterium]|nr:Imm40 family immunity protein [Saprospiraceae bacterium]